MQSLISMLTRLWVLPWPLLTVSPIGESNLACLPVRCLLLCLSWQKFLFIFNLILALIYSIFFLSILILLLLSLLSKLTFYFLHAERPCSRLATPPLLHQVLISHQTLQHQSARACLIRQLWAQLAGHTILLPLHLLLWELLLVLGAPNRLGGWAWGSSKQAHQMGP